MKNLLLSILCLAAPVAVSAQSLLPLPQQLTEGKGFFRTDKPYRVENAAGNIVANPYNDFTKGTAADGDATRRVVRFENMLSNTSKPSEAYQIRVSADTILVRAAKADGFLRAAQTLRQLATAKGVKCCDISDEPAYEWRGVMLDVSRHFFPIDYLRKQIDVLASYKINRLHLHLTDAAGWRMEIKRYPRLTSFAAWRTDSLWKTWWNNGERHYAEEGTPGAYGGYYKQSELKELVAYAAERGITIVPEIEMPAHSEETLTAYPELSCTHVPYKQADFCPGSVATYDFLENVLKEVMEVFPSHDIHVGGDEAAKASWPDCPLCQQKMKELGLENVDGLQAHLIAHMDKFLQENGRRLVAWDEVLTPTLPTDATVMLWRGLDAAKQAARQGNDVVLSPGVYCYLDSYQDAPHTQPEAIGGYLTLEKVYSYVPDDGMTAEEAAHIRGVQGNLWAEYIPTTQHNEHMLYPRALAIAEIGWNGTREKNYPDFRRRALAQVEWLRNEKGVNAFDLKNEAGERAEKSQPVKHKALNAKVTYNKPWHEAYPAAGATTLTDGQRGGWANNDGRWQGFIGKDCFDVTIDLGAVQRIGSVACDFMQACGPEIFYPSEYVVSLSSDGKNFSEVYHHKEKSEKTIQPDVRTYQWKGKSTQARYIRVQAVPSTFGGWLFADEIVVK